MKEKQSLFGLARILAVLGGIVTVVSGARDVLSLVERRNFPNIEAATSAFVYSAIVIGLGLVGLVGSRQVKSVIWNIVLIVIGFLAYEFDGGFPWLLGPALIVLAGVVGLVARLG